MILKILILAVVCLLYQTHAYTQENGIIVLTNDDLDNITSIYPHLFVKYYVPWCRHCQQLAPIFQEIAKELQNQNSSIRIAKINCQENEKAYQFQNIQHFPTLIFYNKGEPLNFDGDRTKSFILKWLTKRLVSPVKEITKEQLQNLATSQSEQVSIVFHGQLESVKGATYTNVAYQDNYNNYYFIKQHTKSYGTVDILRSFAQDQEYPFPDQSFQFWISEHDRPSVVPLDDRSISSLFRDGRLGVLHFLQNKYVHKKAEFRAAADYWKNKTDLTRLIFVNVPEEHEDYFGLLQYMDVNPVETPIIIINSELQKKYVPEFNVSQVAAQRIIQFLHDFNEGKVKESPLENQNAHKHHHDHDHDHDQHHHHHHQHDHHGHHHHHHHDHESEHQHEDQHDHEHSQDCKHHHHHHHQDNHEQTNADNPQQSPNSQSPPLQQTPSQSQIPPQATQL